MAKTRAIVKRRKAIRNIKKITRTMELIATARFKKCMDRAAGAEAYTKRISQLVVDLSRSATGEVQHPLLEEHPKTERSLLLVLTSNRGLCGGYNANVLRMANKCYERLFAEHPVELEVSGKRGIAYFRYRNVKANRTFQHFEHKTTFAEVEELADRYIQLYISGQIDRLDIAYTRFVSLGRQSAEVHTLLPMSSLDVDGAGPKDGSNGTVGAEVEYEFLPSAGDILTEIVPVSFKTRLLKCFLDAAVSEQINRMVAMKGATENAGNLITMLSRQYNRARQSQITSELGEIIGTAEALK